MAIPHPLPEPVVELVAERFRCMGEPMRIRILEFLRDGERTVGEITTALGATQQNVSKHLGVLNRAGIVSRRKEGTAARYAIADPMVLDLCERVCASLRDQVNELADLLGEAAR